MERVNRIITHPRWCMELEKITELEQNRRFCRHGLDHLLDTARIAYIENLEKGLGIEKEIIYAAALLHDIGRGMQYEEGVPHDRGSAMIASEILPQCGFSKDETADIIGAIEGHRNKDTSEDAGLSGLIYRADKLSRNCFFCNAQSDCNWSDEKKNKKITR